MTPVRVLVVDDEYGVRSGIRQILEIEGYEVEEAATGEEALALLRSRTFDIGLLDYRLPDMDGLTIQQTIKNEHLQLMTCMITAYANIDTAIAATREGVDFCPSRFCPTTCSAWWRPWSGTSMPATRPTACARTTRPACWLWPRRRRRHIRWSRRFVTQSWW